jgi:hypothetical protein
LDCEIEPLRRRVGARLGHDVLLAQDRCGTFEKETGSLIAVGDDAIPDQDAFSGLEFDLERNIVLWGDASVLGR